MGRKWSGKIRSTRTFEAQRGALQFRVIAIADEDRKAGLIRVDPGYLPPVQSLAGESLHFRNGQFPNNIKNKTVPRIEKRRAVSRIKICRAYQFLEARGVVERLAVRVGGLELHPVAVALLEQHLQRIVVGVRHIVLGKYVRKYWGPICWASNSAERVAIWRRIRPQPNQIYWSTARRTSDRASRRHAIDGTRNIGSPWRRTSDVWKVQHASSGKLERILGVLGKWSAS